MRSGEMNRNEFHFVSQEEMERDIQANKFLEYGESKGHLYGLSVKAVKRVIENNKVPVLELHPQVSDSCRWYSTQCYIFNMSHLYIGVQQVCLYMHHF